MAARTKSPAPKSDGIAKPVTRDELTTYLVEEPADRYVTLTSPAGYVSVVPVENEQALRDSGYTGA